jgi:hypothetical protein
LVANFPHKNIEKGCFENGNHIRYKKMKIEKKYDFRNIRVIIKDYRDPYVYIYHDPKILEEIKENNASSIGIVIQVLLLIVTVRSFHTS